jgi:hypothetical protein
VNGQFHPEALKKLREHHENFRHGKIQTDAGPRPGAERQIGAAYAGGRVFCEEALGTELVRIWPIRGMPVRDIRKNQYF